MPFMSGQQASCPSAKVFVHTTAFWWFFSPFSVNCYIFTCPEETEQQHFYPYTLWFIICTVWVVLWVLCINLQVSLARSMDSDSAKAFCPLWSMFRIRYVFSVSAYNMIPVPGYFVILPEIFNTIFCKNRWFICIKWRLHKSSALI